MSRLRPQHVVLIAILAAQLLLIVGFSLADDPLPTFALLGSGLGSALLLLDDARRPRVRCAAATGDEGD